jgi:hypothetical protein
MKSVSLEFRTWLMIVLERTSGCSETGIGLLKKARERVSFGQEARKGERVSSLEDLNSISRMRERSSNLELSSFSLDDDGRMVGADVRADDLGKAFERCTQVDV